MSEIGNTVYSGITGRSRLRIAYFLIIPVILCSSLAQTSTVQALSLPIVDRLLDKLLPLDNPNRNNSAQPSSNPSTTTPPASGQQPEQPSPQPVDGEVSVQTAPISIITPLEPIPDSQPVALAGSLGASMPNNDEHDVLAERMESAAASSHQASFLSPKVCAQFFGMCWYIAIPTGVAVITASYLLMTKRKYGLVGLVSRLK